VAEERAPVVFARVLILLILALRVNKVRENGDRKGRERNIREENFYVYYCVYCFINDFISVAQPVDIVPPTTKQEAPSITLATTSTETQFNIFLSEIREIDKSNNVIKTISLQNQTYKLITNPTSQQNSVPPTYILNGTLPNNASLVVSYYVFKVFDFIRITVAYTLIGPHSTQFCRTSP
jgi:hypothetical protein